MDRSDWEQKMLIVLFSSDLQHSSQWSRRNHRHTHTHWSQILSRQFDTLGKCYEFLSGRSLSRCFLLALFLSHMEVWSLRSGVLQAAVGALHITRLLPVMPTTLGSFSIFDLEKKQVYTNLNYNKSKMRYFEMNLLNIYQELGFFFRFQQSAFGFSCSRQWTWRKVPY